LPLSRIARFLLVSMVALVGLIVPWYYLSPYLATPVIAAAGELMLWLFRWVEGVEQHGTVGTLLTSLNVLVPQGGRLVVAQLSPEVNYRSFGYGLALFYALMLASWPTRLWLKLALGTCLLVPSQVVSMCFRWLRDALLVSGPEVLEQTGLPRWALEVIAYGYQFGFLMLTPLVPVLLWLALDRRFVQQLWVEMSLAGAMERQARP
jgi:hypothetical protein